MINQIPWISVGAKSFMKTSQSKIAMEASSSAPSERRGQNLRRISKRRMSRCSRSNLSLVMNPRVRVKASETALERRRQAMVSGLANCADSKVYALEILDSADKEMS